MTTDITEVWTVARGRTEGDAAVGAEVRPAMAARWRRWCVEDALPFWRNRGLTDGDGLFLERLTLTGEPVRDADLRVRAQARQIFCFATACAHGFDPQGGELARFGFERLWRCAHAPNGAPGWVHVLSPTGTVRDARRRWAMVEVGG